jgi:hypothetical protein
MTEMPKMQSIPFLASADGPAWLPAAAKDARQFAYWGQLVMLVMGLIALIMAIASALTGEWFSVVYFVIALVVLGFLFYMMNQTVFVPIDQGKFREASDKLLIWGVIGLIFLVIPGIFLLLAFVRLQEVFQPQYQQYPTQYYQQPQQYGNQGPPPGAPPQAPPVSPPPQAHPAPPPAPAPGAGAPSSQQKTEMIKCKNCGVQYPAFMRNCPNCGAPR